MDLFKTKSVTIILNGDTGVRTRSGFCLSIFVISITLAFAIYALIQFFENSIPIISEEQLGNSQNYPVFPLELFVSDQGTILCSETMVEQLEEAGYQYDPFYCAQITEQGEAPPFGNVCYLSYIVDLTNLTQPMQPSLICTQYSQGAISLQYQEVAVYSGLLVAGTPQIFSGTLVDLETDVLGISFFLQFQQGIQYSITPSGLTQIIGTISGFFSLAMVVALLIGTHFLLLDQSQRLNHYMDNTTEQKKDLLIKTYILAYLFCSKSAHAKLKEIEIINNKIRLRLDLQNLKNKDSKNISDLAPGYNKIPQKSDSARNLETPKSVGKIENNHVTPIKNELRRIPSDQHIPTERDSKSKIMRDNYMLIEQKLQSNDINFHTQQNSPRGLAFPEINQNTLPNDTQPPKETMIQNPVVDCFVEKTDPITLKNSDISSKMKVQSKEKIFEQKLDSPRLKFPEKKVPGVLRFKDMPSEKKVNEINKEQKLAASTQQNSPELEVPEINQINLPNDSPIESNKIDSRVEQDEPIIIRNNYTPSEKKDQPNEANFDQKVAIPSEQNSPEPEIPEIKSNSQVSGTEPPKQRHIYNPKMDFFVEKDVPIMLNGKKGLGTKSGLIISIIIITLIIVYAILLMIPIFSQQSFQISSSEEFLANVSTPYAPEIAIFNPTYAGISGGSNVLSNFESCSEEILDLMNEEGYDTSSVQCTFYISTYYTYDTLCILNNELNLSDEAYPFTKSIYCYCGNACNTVFNFAIKDTTVNVETREGLLFQSSTTQSEHILHVNYMFGGTHRNVMIQPDPIQIDIYRQYNSLFSIIPQLLGGWTILMAIGAALKSIFIDVEEAIIFYRYTYKAKDYSMKNYIQSLLCCKRKALRKYFALNGEMQRQLELNNIVNPGKNQEKSQEKSDVKPANSNKPKIFFDLFMVPNIPFVVRGGKQLRTSIGNIMSFLLLTIIIGYAVYTLYEIYSPANLIITTQNFGTTNAERTSLSNIEVFFIVDPAFSGPATTCSTAILSYIQSENIDLNTIYCPEVGPQFTLNSNDASPNQEICLLNTFVSKGDISNPVSSGVTCSPLLGNQIALASNLIRITDDLNPFLTLKTSQDIQYNEIYSMASSMRSGSRPVQIALQVNPIATEIIRSREKISTTLGRIKGLFLFFFFFLAIITSKLIQRERAWMIYQFNRHDLQSPIHRWQFWKYIFFGSKTDHENVLMQEKKIDQAFSSLLEKQE